MVLEGLVCKCHGCGDTLNIQEGKRIIECESCGIKNVIPKMITPDIQNIYDRANDFRLAGEFDRAQKMYESLIADSSDDSELYWNILLCKFGIRFEEDPGTKRVHPTIQKMQNVSILSDEDYKKAIEFAAPEEAEVYKEQAEKISDIQAKYASIVRTESPYDIFISYKETDKNGRRTLDSALAQNIYDVLTKEGYKVFYSRITLEDKLGEEYEPYIFAALNSAKVMILVSTSVENINSTWVKNEWNRYLKLMSEDKSKHFIPMYKGISAYDLPESMAIYQAQDLDQIGYEQNLVRGISKLIEKSSDNTDQGQFTQLIDNYLKRASLDLESRNFKSAYANIEKVLDFDAENAMAYLYIIMCKCQANSLDELRNSIVDFATFDEFFRFCRFSKNEDLVQELKEIAQIAKNNKHQAELKDNNQRIINFAMENIKTGSYRSLKEAWELIETVDRSVPGASSAIDEVKELITKADKERRRDETHNILIRLGMFFGITILSSLGYAYFGSYSAASSLNLLGDLFWLGGSGLSGYYVYASLDNDILGIILGIIDGIVHILIIFILAMVLRFLGVSVR